MEVTAITEATGTAERILEAAFRRLHADGYAKLSTRDIARDAGVNHALIHYYFGTKDKLVMAALDEKNRRLVHRQAEMYEAAGSYSELWATSLRFYREDLASGFVRVQMELWGASLSNEALRQEFLPRILDWVRLVVPTVVQAVKDYELDLPVSPEAVAGVVAALWIGAEFESLIGISEEDDHHDKALEAVGVVLGILDERRRRGNT